MRTQQAKMDYLYRLFVQVELGLLSATAAETKFRERYPEGPPQPKHETLQRAVAEP
jgi:hypothetical protein